MIYIYLFFYIFLSCSVNAENLSLNKTKNKEIFDITPNANEIAQGKNFIVFYNNLSSGDNIFKGVEKKFFDQIVNSNLFSEYKPFINQIVEIHFTNTNQLLEKKCLTENFLNQSKHINVLFRKRVVEFCLFKYLSNGKYKINDSEKWKKIIGEGINYIPKGKIPFIISQIKKSDSNNSSYNQFLSILKNENNKKNILNEVEMIDKNTFSTITNKKKSKQKIKSAEYLKVRNKVRELRKGLQEQTIKKNELEKQIDELFAEIEINKKNIPQEKLSLLLTYFAKTLQGLKNYDSSLKILKFTLKTVDKKNYYSTVFNLFWNYFLQKKFTQALKISRDVLSDKDNTIKEKFLFWNAYILEKINQPKKAFEIYKKIILLNPFSYYSIMALNQSYGISNEAKALETEMIKKLLSPNNSYKFNSSLFSEQIINQWKRIQIFSKLNALKLLKLETTILLSTEKNSLFKSLEYGNSFSSEEYQNFLVLFAGKILKSSKSYLSSFVLLYQALSSGKVTPSWDLFKSLFPNPYEENVTKISKNIDPTIIMSLIRQESAFNPNARSPAGAVGLMQIMPPTARTLKRHIRVKDLFTPEKNIELGVKYFENLYKKYQGNLIYTLAAYNAGDKNLQEWTNNILSDESILHAIESIPFNETRLYVQLIFRNIYFYKLLQAQTDKDRTKIDDVIKIYSSGRKITH